MAVFYCHHCDNYIDGDYNVCSEDPINQHQLICEDCEMNYEELLIEEGNKEDHDYQKLRESLSDRVVDARHRFLNLKDCPRAELTLFHKTGHQVIVGKLEDRGPDGEWFVCSTSEYFVRKGYQRGLWVVYGFKRVLGQVKLLKEDHS